MKFLGFTSILCLVTTCAVCNSYAVNMTSQIQRLLNEKQEKLSKLEECDGKRKGFMIAGISTIGLTAVGIGGNIALANKSNKLSNQIEDTHRELEKQQSNLANVNSQISEIRDKQKLQKIEEPQNKVEEPVKKVEENKQPILDTHPNIGDECSFVEGGKGVWTEEASGTNTCIKGTEGLVPCACVTVVKPLLLVHGGVIGQPCTKGLKNIVDNKNTGKYMASDKGDMNCKLTEDDTAWTIPCVCQEDKKSADTQTSNKVVTKGNSSNNKQAAWADFQKDVSKIYATYHVGCNNSEDNFAFYPDVSGYTTHAERVRAECKQYNGELRETRMTATRTINDDTSKAESLVIQCINAYGCNGQKTNKNNNNESQPQHDKVETIPVLKAKSGFLSSGKTDDIIDENRALVPVASNVKSNQEQTVHDVTSQNRDLDKLNFLLGSENKKFNLVVSEPVDKKTDDKEPEKIETPQDVINSINDDLRQKYGAM